MSEPLSKVFGIKKVNTAGSRHPDIENQVEGYNRAIDDIDQLSPDVEALAQLLYRIDNPDSYGSTIKIWQKTGDRKWFENKYVARAQEIINKMNVWIKR